MSWQSPPFNPSRAKLWKGGFTRIFGCVSDGVTGTFGLRKWCDAYMVLVDNVVLDPAAHYSVVYPNLVLSDVPPKGAWIEVVGFGLVSDIVVAPDTWYKKSWSDLRETINDLPVGISNRYTWNHDPNVDAESASGSIYHPETDKVYLIPQDASHIAAVDVDNLSVQEVDTEYLDLYDDNKFAGGALAKNGKIYTVPDAAGYIAEFDPRDGSNRMIPIADFEGEAVWTHHMFECGAVLGHMSYGIPFDAKYILVINNLTGEVAQRDFGYDLSMPGKWHGVFYWQGSAFAVPYNHHSYLKIDPDGSISMIPLNTPNAGKAAKYRGGCVVGDYAYLAPFNARHVLKTNLSTSYSEELDVGVDLGGRFKYWGCAHGWGKVFFSPHDARYALELDVSTDTAVLTRFGLPDELFDRDYAFAGAMSDPRGKVHLFSYQTAASIVLDEIDEPKVWRQETRTDMHTMSDDPDNFFAATDTLGKAMLLPWRNNTMTPWTIDTTKYALDKITTGLPIVSPMIGTADHWYHGDESFRQIVGAYDFGDLRFQMQDDGDVWRSRASGMELYAEVEPDVSGGISHRASITAECAQPLDTDWHFPRWTWARNKAFYGLHDHDSSNQLVSLPQSQPFFVNRRREFVRARQASDRVKLNGWSRDQWYNGSIRGADGLIWGIPYNGTHVMHFDVDREQKTLGTYGMNLLDRRKWYGGVRAGKWIYGIPFDRPAILVIDTESGTVTESDFGLDLSGRRKYMSAIHRDGKVYFIPCDAENFIVLDVATQTAQFTKLGISDAEMAKTLKWGSVGINQAEQIVCGALGTTASSRPMCVIELDDTAFVTTEQYSGMGAGVMYIEGNLIFRIKSSWGQSLATRPFRTPSLMVPASKLNQYRTYIRYWIDHDSVYVIDHWVYGLTDTMDCVYSIATEDWSTYNERYDVVPGVRPWIGLAPAALTHYDPDEMELYPENELRAYRKEALWNDPHYIDNNTSYAVNCCSGIMTRNTVQSYNHFREYLRETNNHEICYWGSVEHTDGRLYPVPHSLPVMDIFDPTTKAIERRYVDPYPGWEGVGLWREGTSFGDKLVFYPWRSPYYCYYDPATNAYEHVKIPDDLYVVNGWRHWVRVDDEIWGIPFNADYFLIIDLHTRAARKQILGDMEEWGNKLWSDAIHWRKAESHADRELSFLLPYNHTKLATMHAWSKEGPPELDTEYFDAEFPGARKWSCWASPSDRRPFMFGVPCNADKFLVVDVRGEEPWTDDFGISLTAGWSQEDKWLSVVNQTINDREFGVLIPYNAQDILLIDWNTNKVYKANYTGAALTGTRKWWGGWAWGDRVSFVPYDANGILEVKFTITVDAQTDDIVISAVGTLKTYGVAMTAMAKWRGVAFMNLFSTIYCAVMIPANHNMFLTQYFNESDRPISTYPAGGPNSDPVSTQLMQIGVPTAALAGGDKWAPLPAVCQPAVDLERPGPDQAEYEFPSWNHDYTLRVTVNFDLPQAFVVPHRQSAEHRGWVGTRFHRSWPQSATNRRGWSLPWTCGTFLMHNGSEVDEFDAGFNMYRQEKFSCAALDRHRNLFCAPYGGTAVLRVNVDTLSREWVTRSTAYTEAVSGCDFIYAARTGRVYVYVGRDYIHGRNALPHQGDIYVDSRPIIKAGDGFVIDTLLAARDSNTFWNSWASFNYDAATARFSCPVSIETCCPKFSISVGFPVEYYSAVAGGGTGFAMIPGSSGMTTTWRSRRGRTFNRKQVQWSAGHGSGRPQAPSTTQTPMVWQNKLYLFNNDMPSGVLTDKNLDPMHYLEIDLVKKRTAVRTPGLRFGGGVSGYPKYQVIPCGPYAYWLLKEPYIGLNETVAETRISFRINVETGVVDKYHMGAANWFRRVFAGHNKRFIIGRDSNNIVRLAFDNTGDYLDRLNLGDTAASLTEDFAVGAGWDPDSNTMFWISKCVSTAKKNVKDGWRVTLTLNSLNLETGAVDTSERVIGVVGDKGTTAKVSACVYKDGFLYAPFAELQSESKADLYGNLVYAKIDLAGYSTVERAPGGSSGNCQFGFIDSAGLIWYVFKGRSDFQTFVTLDTEHNAADRPLHFGHIQARNGFTDQLLFNPIMAQSGSDTYYMVPEAVQSRAAHVYRLQTTAGDRHFVIRGYHEPKLPRKWNGFGTVDGELLYGMPSGNNRVLRLNLSGADPVADQVEVEKFYGISEWERHLEEFSHGNVMSGIMHRSDPAEGVSRGAMVNKYGTILGVPQVGRLGQTVEIRSDNVPAMRAPGPFLDLNRKWLGAVEGDDGRIYAAPFDAPEVLVIDPVTMMAGTAYANMLNELDGMAKYSIAVKGTGCVYMLPFSAQDVLKVDHANETMSKFIPVGISLAGENKWWSSIEENGKHYLTPYDSAFIGVFDPAAETLNGIPVPPPYSGEDVGGKWRQMIKARDDRYYAAPFNADDILMFDPVTNQVERFVPEMQFNGSNKWLHHIVDTESGTHYWYGGASSVVVALTYHDDKFWGEYLEPDKARDALPDQYMAARTFTAEDGPDDTAPVIDLIPMAGKLESIKNGEFTRYGVDVLKDKFTTAIPTTQDFTYYIPKTGAELSYTNSRLMTTFRTFKAVPRIPDADKYGSPALLDGVAYFPPNGSKAWLTLDKESYEVELFDEAAIEGVPEPGVSLEENCYYAVPFGSRIIAPAIGSTHFLVFDPKTGVTDKTSFGFSGSFIGTLSDSIGTGDGVSTLYHAVDDGIISVSVAGVKKLQFSISLPKLSLPSFSSIVWNVDRKRFDVQWLSKPAWGTSLFAVYAAGLTGGGVYWRSDLLFLRSWVLRSGDYSYIVGVRVPQTGVGGSYVLQRIEDDGSLTVVASTVDLYLNPASYQVFDGQAFADDTYAYLATSTHIWRLVLAGGTTRMVNTGTVYGSLCKYTSKTGTHVLIPFNMNRFANVVNGTSTITLTTRDIAGVETMSENAGHFKCAYDDGDRVFCFPYSGNKIGIITKGDTDAEDTIEYTDFGLALPDACKYRFVFKRGHHIIAVPEQGKYLVIDLDLDEAQLVTAYTQVLFNPDIRIHEDGADCHVYLDDELWGARMNISAHTAMVPVDPENPGAGTRPSITVGVELTEYNFGIGADSDISRLSLSHDKKTLYATFNDSGHYRNPPLAVLDLDSLTGSIISVDSDLTAKHMFTWVDDVTPVDSEVRLNVLLNNTGGSWSYNSLYRFPAGADTTAMPGWLKLISSTNAQTTHDYVPIRHYPDSRVPELTASQVTAMAAAKPEGGVLTLYPGVASIRSSAGLFSGGVPFHFGWDGKSYMLEPNGVVRYTERTGGADNAPIYDPFVAEIAFKGTDASVRDAWKASATVNGITYVMPYDGKTLLELTGVSGFVNLLKRVPDGRAKYENAIAVDDNTILCIPWNAGSFAWYDIAERAFTPDDFGFDPDLGVFSGNEKYKFAHVDHDKDRIVVLPHRANQAIVITISTREAVTVPLAIPNIVEGVLFWGDWFELAGKFYGVPYDADYMVMFDIDTGEMTRVMVNLDLSGAEKWGCGYPTSNGDLIFLPYREEQALYFDPTTRMAYKSAFDTKADLLHLRPLGDVVRWWNNQELLPENAQKPGADASDSPGGAVDFDWFALSVDTGVSRYDRDTGNILTAPRQWKAYDLVDKEQFMSFLYNGTAGVVFGIPYNAREILVVKRGDNAVYPSLSKMTPSLRVKHGMDFMLAPPNEPCNYTWRVHADNFMAGGYTNNLEPIYVSGGACANVLVDSFSGIVTLDPVNDIMEWNRPVRETSLSVTKHFSCLFQTALLAPDGCTYMFASDAEWGLVSRGISGANDKIFMPKKVVEVNTIFHPRPELATTVIPVACASVTPTGRILLAPGHAVTYGVAHWMTFKTVNWFDMEVEYPNFRDLDDARGTTWSRKRHWLRVLDTGYYADTKQLAVISPMVNNR